MEMEQKDCSLKVEKFIEKYAWITSEKQLFGRSGTDYDFASRDPSKARAELDILQTEQSGCVAQKPFLSLFFVFFIIVCIGLVSSADCFFPAFSCSNVVLCCHYLL